MKVTVSMAWKNLCKKNHLHGKFFRKQFVRVSTCCFSVVAKGQNIDLEPVNFTFPLCTGVHLFCLSQDVRHPHGTTSPFVSSNLLLLCRVHPEFSNETWLVPVWRWVSIRWHGTFMCTTCLFLWEQVVLGSFLCLWLWQLALNSDLVPFCLVNRCL